MINGRIPAETVGKILDRLSQDHDFREHFIGDPVGALEQYGVQVDPSKIPAVRKLAPMSECAQLKARAADFEQPENRVCLFPFLLS